MLTKKSAIPVSAFLGILLGCVPIARAVELSETSAAGPGLFMSGSGDYAVVAWVGTDPGHSLNILRSQDLFRTSFGRATIGEQSTHAPAVYVSPTSLRIYLAWTAPDGRVWIAASPTYDSSDFSYKVFYDDWSATGPALAEMHGHMYYAYTGPDSRVWIVETDYNLNVISYNVIDFVTPNGPSLAFDSTTNVLYASMLGVDNRIYTFKSADGLNFEMTSSGIQDKVPADKPALSGNTISTLAVVTDSSDRCRANVNCGGDGIYGHHLAIAQKSCSGAFGATRVLNAVSSFAPAASTFAVSCSARRSVLVAWTSSLTSRLNIALDDSIPAFPGCPSNSGSVGVCRHSCDGWPGCRWGICFGTSSKWWVLERCDSVGCTDNSCSRWCAVKSQYDCENNL